MQARVTELVAQHAVVMFSWVSCPYCVRAKKLLETVTSDLQVHYLDKMGAEGDQLQAAIVQMTNGHDTVPAIWVKGTFVGGCSDVEGLHKQGKLAKMLV